LEISFRFILRTAVPSSDGDRALLQRCLNHEAGAWSAFVDRFLGLVFHVVRHSAYLLGMPLQSQDIEDIVAEIMLEIIKKDYAVLRQFKGQSSLATYLIVVARRTCMRELNRRLGEHVPQRSLDRPLGEPEHLDPPPALVQQESREEVEKLLRQLPAPERHVVRLFYLEGRTYQEISAELHIPVNSIGPMLFRSRQKLRGNVKTPVS
jgi:RNA polymerase sigma-70 factor (ECF subfamily)